MNNRKIYGFRIITNVLVYFVLVFYTQPMFSQEEGDSHNQDASYFTASVGMSHVTFRDLATSPLFYQGMGGHIKLDWFWSKPKYETLIESDLLGALTRSKTPESSFFQTSSQAYVVRAELYHHYLRKIELKKTPRINWFLGGGVYVTLPVRGNPSLGNSGIGVDPMFNLVLSNKISLDISRKQTKDFSFWFIKKKLQPVKRSLSLLVNIGVLNMNYRPGYAYSFDAEFNGSDTGLFGYYFSDYKWSVNGWRLGTRLEFTKFRPNGNGIKFFYLWEACHSPGRHEAFQWANHRIGFSLMIHRK